MRVGKSVFESNSGEFFRFCVTYGLRFCAHLPVTPSSATSSTLPLVRCLMSLPFRQKKKPQIETLNMRHAQCLVLSLKSKSEELEQRLIRADW